MAALRAAAPLGLPRYTPRSTTNALKRIVDDHLEDLRRVHDERFARDPKQLRYSGEQRLLSLDVWRRSSLPAADFAPLVGVSMHSLYKWKKVFETDMRAYDAKLAVLQKWLGDNGPGMEEWFAEYSR